MKNTASSFCKGVFGKAIELLPLVAMIAGLVQMAVAVGEFSKPFGDLALGIIICVSALILERHRTAK
jgi:hypothetical protein